MKKELEKLKEMFADASEISKAFINALDWITPMEGQNNTPEMSFYNSNLGGFIVTNFSFDKAGVALYTDATTTKIENLKIIKN